MEISVIHEQSDLLIDSSAVQAIVKEVLALEQKRCDEVAIHFVTLDAMSKLHADYFDDPSPTDCITFPVDTAGSEGYCLLGEVFVCPAVAIDYAKEHRGCPFEETTLYIVHGMLHLLEYNDLDDKEIKQMRQAEQRHMENLKLKKLVLPNKL